ncbi:unnamed protein product [Schistosoma turkestanicum]|nr:unnamed protein product [Schistosoma turkestanicum]
MSYNKGMRMAYLIFFVIFMSIILTTGNTKYLSASAASESKSISNHTVAGTNGEEPGGSRRVKRSMIAAADGAEAAEAGAGAAAAAEAGAGPAGAKSSDSKAAATGAAMNIVSPAKAYYALQLLALVMIRLVC